MSQKSKKNSDVFVNFFPFQWQCEDISLDDNSKQTVINIYGWNERNESVYIKIQDFQIPIWVEVPFQLSERHQDALFKFIMNKCLETEKPSNISVVNKKQLYFADVEYEHKHDNTKPIYTHKTKQYLQITFRCQLHIDNFVKKIRFPQTIPCLGRDIVLKPHCFERSITPIIKFLAVKQLPSSSWIRCKASQVPQDSKETSKNHEYIVSWNNVKSHPKPEELPIVHPKILSFDNEAYSHDHNRMPQSKEPSDCVFMIGCTIQWTENKEKKRTKYLLVIGDVEPYIDERDNCPVEILKFDNEYRLLIGFAKFIRDHNPDVIIGYNIFGFDIKYMSERGNLLNCFKEMSKLGCFENKVCPLVRSEWSSIAYGKQDLLYYEADGRLYIDLYPYIVRNYKLSNYKLDTVCAEFLPSGMSKDPIKAKEMFKIFESKNSEGMLAVGKYCVQDSYVTLLIFEKLLVWFDLVEAATTCCVPMVYLYTKGQQIKIYSQMLKYCFKNDIILQSGAYEVKEDEDYVGATVTKPKAGLYKMILPFDFASLYPSIMMAHNIDYSKLVVDTPVPNPNVKDEDCWIFEWTEHYNCAHDSVKRPKGKDGKVKRICDSYRFRFLRADKEIETNVDGVVKKIKVPVSGKGVMPTLLENLINARKSTRKVIAQNEEEIKKLKDEGNYDKANELIEINQVLDKRQLSYKVSANSMYGAMGVKKGYLPFLPGAMVVTYTGRESIKKASRFLEQECGGQVIYNDTDSAYTYFESLNNKTASEIWSFAADVVKRVAKLFPPPMKLEFEDKVYAKFLILTKKRYVGIMMDESGKMGKLAIRGVVLTRRDNCSLLRDLYKCGISYIMDHVDELTKINPFMSAPEILKNQAASGLINLMTEGINDLFNRCPKYTYKDFVITKGLTKDVYKSKTVPVHVAVADKMKSRGIYVPQGARIEYLLLDRGGAFDKNEKQNDKAEDVNYFVDNRSDLRIDYLFYLLKQIVKPIDEMVGKTLHITGLIKNHFELRLQKHKIAFALKRIWQPKICIMEEASWSNSSLYDFTYCEGGMPQGWIDFFEMDEVKKEILQISNYLEKDKREIFPSITDVWKTFVYTPYKECKVVILGQDPYHTLMGSDEGVTDTIPACGIAFMVKSGHQINPSLKNIFKELKNCGFKCDDNNGDLTNWCLSGVLLLNTALTVARGQAESHLNIWKNFTNLVVSYIGKKTIGLLWGKHAISFKDNFLGSVISTHPSPLSAYKNGPNIKAFDKSFCFRSVNTELKNNSMQEINWSLI